MLHWHVFNVTYVLLHFWTTMQINPRTFLFSSEKDAWDQRSEWQGRSAGSLTDWLATTDTVRHKPLSRHPCHLSYTPVTILLLCTKTRMQGAGGQATLGWAGLCKAKLRKHESGLILQRQKESFTLGKVGTTPSYAKERKLNFLLSSKPVVPNFSGTRDQFGGGQFFYRPGE